MGYGQDDVCHVQAQSKLKTMYAVSKLCLFSLSANGMGFPGGATGKETACNAGDTGSVPESGRSPGGGCGNPLQYSCLENLVDRGAWQATVHEIAKSWTWLSN